MSEGERSREEAVMTHDGMTTLVMAWPMAGAGLGARKQTKVLGVVWEGDTQRLACMLILFNFN